MLSSSRAVTAGGLLAVPSVKIQPREGWTSLGLMEVWEHRELLYFLVWRNVKVRYKQTALGAAWAILQPVLGMLIFTLFFGRLARLPSDGIPYPLFTFAALVPWTSFINALTDSSNSLVGSANLISKVYFPRLCVPLSAILTMVVDFAIAFVVLLVMMFHYRVVPTANVIWLPVLGILALATALGVGLWLSALNVKYRDVRYVLPFLTQLWMFATPIVYPSSILDEPWKSLYGINPMVGVVEGFRWGLLGTKSPGLVLIVSAIVAGILLFTGLVYFRRTEETFADII